MGRIQIPCLFRNQKISVEVNKKDTVLELRTKIASSLKKDPSQINLFFANGKLSNNTNISELQLEESKNSAIQVSLALKPLIKRKIHISSKEEESKLLFLKREMKFVISNSDNITSVLAAQNIINSSPNVSISELFSNSIQCPYICSYIFNLFKQEISKSIDNQTISIIFNQCKDLKLTGHIFNYLSEANENLVSNFIKPIQLDKNLLALIEHSNFANKSSIIKKILSKIAKYKGDLASASPSLIIFINNISCDDKNYFSEIFSQTRDIKRSKYKNSPEVRMLLLAISIKCDKVQETLKRYDKLLTTSIEKPKLARAVLSTVHQLYLLSLNEETRCIDLQTIKSIINLIPKKYEQEDFIHFLINSSINSNPDIFQITNDEKIKFSDSLEFAYSHNFQLILKYDIIKETYLMNIFSWISNGLNFMKIFKMIYDITASPDFPSAINSLFLIYSSAGPEICSSSLSISPDSYLHHHAYYPSQIIDSIFNLLTLFVDILPKNETMRKLDSRYIFEFSFLFLLRPNLSIQKAALKIIRKICKYKNNDDLSELAINDSEGRKKRRTSVDSNKDRSDLNIYKSLMDQINDSSFNDLNESCRIIRGALLYFVKSPQSFRDEVFNLADLTSGESITQKIQNLQEVQKQQLDQLQKNISLEENPQNQQIPIKPEKEQQLPKKTKSLGKGARNASSQQRQNQPPSKSVPYSAPTTPIVGKNPFYKIGALNEINPIEDLSYSAVYLKILLDRIEKNFDGYIPFIKSRLDFTSIAFSFISFGGNSSDIRQSFLNFVSSNNSITTDEKLELLFRFVQNGKKLESKVSRQSDSHISIKKFHTITTPLISNSFDRLIIPNRQKRQKPISNQNLDSSCYERELNIIFDIFKSFKNTEITSEKFSYQRLMYFYIASQLAFNKSLSQDFGQLMASAFDVFSKPKCIVYENLRLCTLSIFYSLYDKNAAYLLPQVIVKPIVDFLKHQDYENKRFFNTIFHSYLIDDEYSLKKAVCMRLSLKAHSKIDISLPAIDILKENPKKAIRILFALLSSKLITNDMVTEVITYLIFFLERKYPIDSRSLSLIVGAKEDVLETLFDKTTDYIIHYLPLFMIYNTFSLKLWKKIAENYKSNVLHCIISVFSAYSGYFSYLNSNGESFDEYEKAPINIKIAYSLFDIYGVKKSKSWQIIALSLLFIERNEFALQHLVNLIDDNDRLSSIKKSTIADHFENPIENLLSNFDKNEVNSAVLEILPLVRSKRNFNKLFAYIQNEKELDTKKVLKSIEIYCNYDKNLVAPSSLFEFLISKIDDENELKNLKPEIKKLILLKKNKYVDEEEDD